MLLRQVARSLGARRGISTSAGKAVIAQHARRYTILARDFQAINLSRVTFNSHANYFSTSSTRRDDNDDEVETTAVKKTRTTRKAATGETTAKKASTTKKTTATKKKKTTATKPKKPVKAKKPAKPKAPKRVLHPPKPINSAWVLYFKERLAAMPKEEKTKVSELSQQLVQDFRSLPSSERAGLDERLKEYKVQYEKDYQEYMRTVTPEMIAEENKYRRAQAKKSPRKKRSLLPIRDPSKPTAPINGFVRFSNAVRNDASLSQEILGVSDAKDLPFTESGKKIADKWKEMSEGDKEPYQSEYLKEKEQFDKDLAAWKLSKEETPAA